MKARTIKGKSADEIGRAIETCLSEGFRPNLAILFISIKLDRRKICSLFEQAQIEVFGATSSGEFIEGHQSERMENLEKLRMVNMNFIPQPVVGWR